MNKGQHISKLPKSPLKEVIFQLLLEQDVDTNGRPTDEIFMLSQGVFAQSIKSDFPVTRSFPENNNIKIFPRISYQFWKGDGIWPVIQIGPGMLSINDTDDNYVWVEFHGLIKKCIENLETSLGKSLKINQVSLRYIDAIEMEDVSFEKKKEFINKNFKMTLNNDFQIPKGNSLGLNFTQTFNMEDESVVSFVISNGKTNKNRPAIVWQNQITNNTFKNKEDVLDWIQNGHQVLSDLFKNSINPEFYDSFK